MSTIIGTMLLAAATALVTTWTTGIVITPRLDARKARILKAHQDRDHFSDSVLTILASCARLEAFEIPSGVPEPLRAALLKERERWLNQIDEATSWLIDNVQRWAGTYPSARGLRGLTLRYALDARGIFLSEREESTKIALLREITEPVQQIFFSGFWWQRAARFQQHRQRLIHALDQLETDTSQA